MRLFGRPRDFEAFEEVIGQRVQAPQSEAELAALRRSVVLGALFGEPSWQQRTARRLGLQSTLSPEVPSTEAVAHVVGGKVGSVRQMLDYRKCRGQT
jgi:hypothetical protein